MKIVVLGAGYVGTTVSACLLKAGHTVVGVDIQPVKVRAFTEGRSPVAEPGIDALFAEGKAGGRLSGTDNAEPHLADADIAIICVGTPNRPDGSLDISGVRAASEQVAAAAVRRDPQIPPLLCVVRSTVPPGTMEGAILPAMRQAAGEPPGARYEVCFNPEFLRESTAIADYFSPPRIVIGERTKGVTDRMRGIYDGIDAPVFEVGFQDAEMIKFADNCFHALKVSFGNEIGRLCNAVGVDAQSLMDMFLADEKLNISKVYLRPGGAFGGSCLPKDVRAINSMANAHGVVVPVIENILGSNAAHKQFLLERVMAAVPRGGRILLLGLSFKSETDDLRESPLVDLAETLLGKGYDLQIHEPSLKVEDLVGANLAYAQGHLPHLTALLVPDLEGLDRPDLVVVGKAMKEAVERLPADWPRLDVHRL